MNCEISIAYLYMYISYSQFCYVLGTTDWSSVISKLELDPGFVTRSWSRDLMHDVLGMAENDQRLPKGISMFVVIIIF